MSPGVAPLAAVCTVSAGIRRSGRVWKGGADGAEIVSTGRAAGTRGRAWAWRASPRAAKRSEALSAAAAAAVVPAIRTWRRVSFRPRAFSLTSLNLAPGATGEVKIGYKAPLRAPDASPAPDERRRAAQALARSRRPHEAFLAWCALARELGPQAPPALWQPTGDALADAVLDLRRRAAAPAAAAAAGPLAGAGRVAILAGAAARMTARQRALLEPLLARALDGFAGVLLSGGTAVGLPGLAGRSARALGLPIIGYVPAGQGDPRLYPRLREGAPGEFSVREPLAMWSDILAGGLGPRDVRLLACPGGAITEEEIALALALGGPVGWLDPAGERVGGCPDGALELGADALTVRAFLAFPPLRPLPAVAELEPEAAAVVALAGLRAVTPAGSTAGAAEMTERLAQARHGLRRLEAIERGESPPAPWDALTDSGREYDREAVATIEAALAAAGWAVTDA